jgi:hypothetical protein
MVTFVRMLHDGGYIDSEAYARVRTIYAHTTALTMQMPGLIGR